GNMGHLRAVRSSIWSSGHEHLHDHEAGVQETGPKVTGWGGRCASREQLGEHGSARWDLRPFSLAMPSPDDESVRASVQLGRVRGVSVGVHVSTLLLVALLTIGLATSELPFTAPGYPAAAYWAAAIVLAVLFLASILAHELAHAAVAGHY